MKQTPETGMLEQNWNLYQCHSNRLRLVEAGKLWAGYAYDKSFAKVSNMITFEARLKREFVIMLKVF